MGYLSCEQSINQITSELQNDAEQNETEIV